MKLGHLEAVVVGLAVQLVAVGCGGSTTNDAAQSGAGGSGGSAGSAGLAGSAGSGGAGGSAGGGGAAGCGAGCVKDASVGCPAAPPDDQSPCPADAAGLHCDYPVPCCGDTVAICSGGAWSVELGPCMGGAGNGAPICPPGPPPDGTACDMGCGAPMTCTYGDCATTAQTVTATCTGVWTSSVFNCQMDGGAFDAGGGLGALCGQSAGGASCAPGLACCYPCGMPGCEFQCTAPCDPGQPGCNGGCLMVP